MDQFSRASVRIEYCVKCKWRLRAAWYAQELLSTFEADLESVALAPSDNAGHFRIMLGSEVVFDRAVDEGFVEAKVLKQRIRDVIAPNRSLGHVDR